MSNVTSLGGECDRRRRAAYDLFESPARDPGIGLLMWQQAEMPPSCQTKLLVTRHEEQVQFTASLGFSS
jgi:hypothetical protein